MLTLGLMEGVLSATFGVLFLIGAANENAPMHKLLGPPATAIAGLAAYMIHDSGAVSAAGDVVGLAFFAMLTIFGPIGIMQAAYKWQKNQATAAPARPAAPVAPRSVATHDVPDAPAAAVEERRAKVA